jgi:outer membrane protein
MITGIALIAATATASAQESKDIRVRVGVGAQLRPDYYGADKRVGAPLWDVDIARGNNQFKFEAPDDHLAIAVIDKDSLSIGPAANIASSRKDSSVGAPLGKVKTTIEAGAFAQYQWGETIRLRAEVLKGIGGHKGVVGAIGGDRVWRDGDRYVFSVGPRILVSDGRYQRAYFGVTPAAALASGLPAYRPGGGIHGVALASGLSYQFNPRVGLFGFGRYERLVGDAARSPVVREFGSRNQLSGGVGLNYTFTVKR